MIRDFTGKRRELRVFVESNLLSFIKGQSSYLYFLHEGVVDGAFFKLFTEQPGYIKNSDEPTLYLGRLDDFYIEESLLFPSLLGATSDEIRD